MTSTRAKRLRTLILSDRSRDEPRSERDRVRFGAFARALASGGIEAEHRLTGDEDELRSAFRADPPDLVFSASLDCAPGPRGRPKVHAVLEEEGLAYVGSAPEVLELAIDKAALKERWLRSGIRTPPYLLAGRDAPLDEARVRSLGFPCIVKPSREGNSRGIGEDSVVRDAASLRAKVEDTVARYGQAIVERFLGDYGDVREFTVAMIGSGASMLAMPAEIELAIPKTVRVITTADKDGLAAIARPMEESGLRARVAGFARAALLAAGVRDYARCDLILAGGEFSAIEINGQPMVPDPWFAACARGAGLDETGYLNAIVLAAIARYVREGRRGISIPSAMRELIPIGLYESLCG